MLGKNWSKCLATPHKCSGLLPAVLGQKAKIPFGRTVVSQPSSACMGQGGLSALLATTPPLLPRGCAGPAERILCGKASLGALCGASLKVPTARVSVRLGLCSSLPDSKIKVLKNHRQMLSASPRARGTGIWKIHLCICLELIFMLSVRIVLFEMKCLCLCFQYGCLSFFL